MPTLIFPKTYFQRTPVFNGPPFMYIHKTTNTNIRNSTNNIYAIESGAIIPYIPGTFYERVPTNMTSFVIEVGKCIAFYQTSTMINDAYDEAVQDTLSEIYSSLKRRQFKRNYSQLNFLNKVVASLCRNFKKRDGVNKIDSELLKAHLKNHLHDKIKKAASMLECFTHVCTENDNLLLHWENHKTFDNMRRRSQRRNMGSPPSYLNVDVALMHEKSYYRHREMGFK